MNVLQYVQSLKPAVPMSNEKPCTYPSNSELRRWITDGSVRINDERWKWDEEAPAYRWSVIFFPKGARRTTIV